jgi:hypothetical protein
MTLRARRLLGVLTLALATSGSASQLPGLASSDLPTKLTDQEFWRLMDDMSEQSGVFPSDNLLSNELLFARVVPDLLAHTKPGGVFLGVGPEQNFTYIAALQPKAAFIADIRRANLQLQLMYKALFELSADRADFVSRLFTKKRPSGLTSSASVSALMDAFWTTASSDEATYTANLKAITDLLTETHALPLSGEDLEGIARVYRTFYWYGPAMNPASDLARGMSGAGRGGPTYRDVVTEVDTNGQGLSFLGSEEKFAFVKDLETRNLVVPIVGDFSGPKALRAIDGYLRDHRATVSVFYLSNVESYLRRDGTWPAFCANVATMPLNETSIFIRVRLTSVTLYPNGTRRPNSPSAAAIVPIAGEIKDCGRSSGVLRE